METLLAFAILIAVILLGFNIWIFARMAEMRRKIDKFDKGSEITDADMKYMKGLELDFASLEEKVDEMGHVQDELANSFNNATEEIDSQGKAIEELESKIDELETIMDGLGEKKDEDEDEEK